MELQSDPGTKGNLAPGPSAILDALLRTLNTEVGGKFEHSSAQKGSQHIS